MRRPKDYIATLSQATANTEAFVFPSTRSLMQLLYAVALHNFTSTDFGLP